MCVPQDFLPYVRWYEELIEHGPSFGIRLTADRNRVAITFGASTNTNIVLRWGQPPDDITQGYLITNAMIGRGNNEWLYVVHGRIMQQELWGRTSTGLANTIANIGVVPADVMGAIEERARRALDEVRASRGLIGAPS